MSKFALIENGVVVQVQPYDEYGFIKADDWVCCGMVAQPDGTFSTPDPTPPSSRALRDQSLAALVHDFGDGRVMQTRPQDESNLRNAIEVMEAQSMSTLGWRMADNTVADVTVADLKDALAAGQVAALQVWSEYNAS